MATLHSLSDAWTPPPDFTRPAWNRAGLLGETPLWDRFWENPELSAEQRKLFLEIRTQANALLSKHEADLDYGLIHADLVPTNIMLNKAALTFIDFDDGGYGFRLFEIATALLKHIDAPDYPALRLALIDGYTSLRDINLELLDIFMLLRALTYVGWNITRMSEAGGKERNARFIHTAQNISKHLITND